MADHVVDILVDVHLSFDDLVVRGIGHVMGVGVVHHGRVAGIGPYENDAVASQQIHFLRVNAEVPGDVVLIGLLANIVDAPVLAVDENDRRAVGLNVNVHVFHQHHL